MTTPPPPGWYPDGHGWRWWDGQRWGPAAPPSPPVAAPGGTPWTGGTPRTDGPAAGHGPAPWSGGPAPGTAGWARPTGPGGGLAPPVDPVGEGKVAAVLCHVSYFVAGLILPLVFLLTEGKRNAFVRHHAAEAVNFALTFLLAWVVAFVVLIPMLVVSADEEEPPLAFLLWLGLVGLLWLGGAIASVVGAVRAGQGVWWRYPLTIRLVRGGVGPDGLVGR